MCLGFPQAVQNVIVQGHVGSDSSPFGSTLVQLLLAIASIRKRGQLLLELLEL